MVAVATTFNSCQFNHTVRSPHTPHSPVTLPALRIAARAGSSFFRQADEYILNKHATTIQLSARRHISRQKMAVRVREVVREIEFVLSRRITPRVKGHLVRVAVASMVRKKGEGGSALLLVICRVCGARRNKPSTPFVK